MEPLPPSCTSYRTSKPVLKGYRVHLWLLPHGAGFRWDVLDDRDRLIKRNLETCETPGSALRSGTEWIERNKEDL
jgi:hypothetical protein